MVESDSYLTEVSKFVPNVRVFQYTLKRSIHSIAYSTAYCTEVHFLQRSLAFVPTEQLYYMTFSPIETVFLDGKVFKDFFIIG